MLQYLEYFTYDNLTVLQKTLQYLQNTTWNDLPILHDTVLTINYLLVYKVLLTLYCFQYTVNSSCF